MVEMDRYYEEGIKPTGRNFFENKKKGKSIIITEEKEQNLVSMILTETFFPTSEKVNAIKDYLDLNFVKQELDTLDSNGFPSKEKTAILVSKEKQPLKTLSMKKLLSLIDDKFKYMVKDDTDRKNFFKQVIKDWYFNEIKHNGVLSVNYV